MEIDLAELKRREELKRDAVLGPARRWRLLMEAIAWAQAQTQRNTPARCLELQRAKLIESADRR